MEDSSLKIEEEFIVELLDQINIGVEISMQLENGFSEDAFDGLLRVLHSLKGTLSMFGLVELSKYIHEFEDFTLKLNEEKSPLGHNVDAFLKFFDLLEHSIQDGNNFLYPKIAEIIKGLDEPDGSIVQTETDEKETAKTVVVEEFDEQRKKKLKELQQKAKVATTSRVLEERNMQLFLKRAKPGVVIIDDEPEVVDMMKDVLSDITPDIHGISKDPFLPRENLGFRPTLFLIDFWLGTVNGIQLVKNLKLKYPKACFLMISGFLDDPHIMRQGLEVGIDGFLTKPFQPNHLKRFIFYKLISQLKNKCADEIIDLQMSVIRESRNQRLSKSDERIKRIEELVFEYRQLKSFAA